MPRRSSKAPDTKPASETGTSRRALLAGAAVAGLAVPLATSVSAATKHHHDDAHHRELVDVALNCVGRGEECVAHCIEVMATGDGSLADCLTSVNEMLPMCGTLARFAALDAKRLSQFAKVCHDVCEDCAKACEKHAAEHEACKVCGDACNDCVKACKDLIAA